MWALVQAVCQLPVSPSPYSSRVVAQTIGIWTAAKTAPRLRVALQPASAGGVESRRARNPSCPLVVVRAPVFYAPSPPHAVAPTFLALAARPSQAASDALGTGGAGSVAHSLATHLADALTAAPAAAADRAARTAHTLLTSVATAAAAPVAAVLSVAAFERLRKLVRGLSPIRFTCCSLALAPTLVTPSPSHPRSSLPRPTPTLALIQP